MQKWLLEQKWHCAKVSLHAFLTTTNNAYNEKWALELKYSKKLRCFKSCSSHNTLFDVKL